MCKTETKATNNKLEFNKSLFPLLQDQLLRWKITRARAKVACRMNALVIFRTTREEKETAGNLTVNLNLSLLCYKEKYQQLDNTPSGSKELCLFSRVYFLFRFLTVFNTLRLTLCVYFQSRTTLWYSEIQLSFVICWLNILTQCTYSEYLSLTIILLTDRSRLLRSLNLNQK